MTISFQVPPVFAAPGCRADACVWQLSAPRLTVVSKITFRIIPGEIAPLLDSQEDGTEIVERDRHHDREPHRSLQAANDLAPVLPGVEALLHGSAYAPEGKPVSTLTAVLRIGWAAGHAWQKAIHVLGDHWGSHTPQPFRSMPLVWERAIRGLNNPVGVDPSIRSPNLLDPQNPSAPAGFGPISPSWVQRRSLLGVSPLSLFDAEPYSLPHGFDFRYFFAAPADQRFPSLNGDEWIQLDGLHPLLPRVQFRLPCVRLALRVHTSTGDAEEHWMVADRLVINTDKQIGTLTYRRGLPIDWTQASSTRLSVGISRGNTSVLYPDLEDPLAECGRYRIQSTGRTADVTPDLARLGSLPFEELVKHKRQARVSSLPLGHQASGVVAPASAAIAGTVALDPAAAELGALPFEELLALAKSRSGAAPPVSIIQAPVPTAAPRTTQPVDASLAALGALPFEELLKLRDARKKPPTLTALPFVDARPVGGAAARIGAASESKRQGRLAPVPVQSDRGIAMATLPWQFTPNDWMLVVIAKGSFSLAEGQAAQPMELSDFVAGDRFVGDDCQNALIAASDFAPIKKSVDVLVCGSAFAPRGEATMMQVRLVVKGASESINRAVAVFGDRTWMGGLLALAPSAPLPFSSMPLRYDLAFGGPSFAFNPVGRGHKGAAGLQGLRSLPNLESLDELIVAPSDTPSPSCLGALPSAASARRASMGTYDEKWQNNHWPYPPADFDYDYMQAAPAAQRLARATGDESFELWGLHPERPVMKGSLGGLRARVFAERESGELMNIPLMLDTITFAPDAERVHVVWRGLVAVSDEDAPELRRLFATYERIAGAPITDAVARIRLDALAKKPDEEPAPAGAPTPANDTTVEDEEAAEKLAALRAKIDAYADSIDRPRAAPFPPPPAAPTEEFTGSPATDPPPRPHVDRRASAEARLREGASLRALELRGVDLSELNLSGQDLSGLDLTEANLTNSLFQGAILDGADLTEAHASRSDFRGASLRRTKFIKAELAGARFDTANLADADFTGATLTGCNFQGAHMGCTRLYDVTAQQARFDDALMTNARGDGACLAASSFVRVQADDSVWETADLSQAVFTLASLKGAGLVHANCPNVSFAGADLSGARLLHAILDGAQFLNANLMGARLDRASMSHTNFDGANLYGASLQRVHAANVVLTRTNLTRTRWEKHRP